MLMPKRVKRRKQFRGSLAVELSTSHIGSANTACYSRLDSLCASLHGSGHGGLHGAAEGHTVFQLKRDVLCYKLPCKCKIVSKADLEGGDNSEE